MRQTGGLQYLDRVFGRIAAVRTDLRRGRVSPAFAGLDELRQDVLADDVVAEVGLVEREAESALGAALVDLERLVAVGDAPKAAARLTALLAPPHTRVERALHSFVAARKWPRLGDVAIPAGLPAMQPAPLPEGRRVRLFIHDVWVDGVTMRADPASGEVTIRAESQGGVVFPSAARATLALVDPAPDELLDQVRAALCAGDARLASVWLACCVARGLMVDEPLALALAPWFTFD